MAKNRNSAFELGVIGGGSVAFLVFIFAVMISVLDDSARYTGLHSALYAAPLFILFVITQILVSGLGGGKRGMGKRK